MLNIDNNHAERLSEYLKKLTPNMPEEYVESTEELIHQLDSLQCDEGLLTTVMSAIKKYVLREKKALELEEIEDKNLDENSKKLDKEVEETAKEAIDKIELIMILYQINDNDYRVEI